MNKTAWHDAASRGRRDPRQSHDTCDVVLLTGNGAKRVLTSHR
jgi:hypothetical protein